MTNKPLREWLKTAIGELSRISDEAVLEAQVLCGHVLGKTRSWVLAHDDFEPGAEDETRLNGVLKRRLAGEPLPYITGERAFYGLDFIVSPAVLIPRPETEMLVDEALKWMRLHRAEKVADVGTGSGCIAVSIAKNLPEAHVWGVDRSREALRIAGANIKRYGLQERVLLWQGELLEATSGSFDVVCANLPYIPSGTVDELAVAKFEPRLALDGGADGLDLIRWLLRDAKRWLAAGGLMLLEIERGQGETGLQAAQEEFGYANVRLLNDLAGLPRLLCIENKQGG